MSSLEKKLKAIENGELVVSLVHSIVQKGKEQLYQDMLALIEEQFREIEFMGGENSERGQKLASILYRAKGLNPETASETLALIRKNQRGES